MCVGGGWGGMHGPPLVSCDVNFFRQAPETTTRRADSRKNLDGVTFSLFYR